MMKREELETILMNHKLWLNHEGGERANLRYADLQYADLVPSFDGTMWRLHSGKNAEIVYEESKE